MQYLLMCEGPNEKAIIDLLIDNKKLIINRKDLLNREVFFSRQIYLTKSVQTALKTYNNEVEVWRIGDTLNDNLTIPKEFKNYIKEVKKYCTKPELEILLIFNQNLFKEYNKVKSKIRPKVFAKNNIKFYDKKYKNETEFWGNYYKNNVNDLVNDIKKYRQYKKNNKNENYLAQILK